MKTNRLYALRQTLAAARSNQKACPSLVTHVVLGYPTLEKSLDIVRAMVDGGAMAVELQIPFSDPMADGPTIMEANQVALANGVRVGDCMAAAEKLARDVSVPLLFMSYFNILYKYGKSEGIAERERLTAFCRDAANAGISGLIVADMPIEEQDEGYWTMPREFGLVPIPLVSPISSDDRLKRIAAIADEDAFVYCVTVTGTTGARTVLPDNLSGYLTRVRTIIDRPLAVGFGISSREQLAALAPHAELGIVGSAMIAAIKGLAESEIVPAIRAKTAELLG